MIIYKYRPINKHTLTLLMNSELFFAPVIHLNDPFDSKLDIDHVLINYFNSGKLSRTEFIDLLLEFEPYKRFMKRTCVLSLSANRDNILMWSHYADHHKGICLGFDKEKISRGFVDISDGVEIPDNVIYSTNVNDSIDKLFTNSNNSISLQLIPRIIHTVLNIKNPLWEYEEEIRFTYVNVEKIHRKFKKTHC